MSAEITPAQSYRSSRSRSRTRTSNNSRLTLSSRRPSFSGSKRSLSASSLNKLFHNPSSVELANEKTVPTISVLLDNSLPRDFFKEELIGLIKALKISKWHKRTLVASNMEVNRILGALTNSIYKLEYRDPLSLVQPPLLLLRVYGKNVDNLIDRDSELKILIKLSAKRIGPKLLGIFSNGRFEQFLEGYVTMGKEEIRNPVISQILGRRMKDLHTQVELDDNERELELPVAWLQISKWLLLFESDFLPTMSKETIEETLLMPWDRFKDLVFAYRHWLFAKYDTDNINANYRFCHNDTQYGNLLLKDTFDPQSVIQPESASPAGSAGISTTNKGDNNMAVIDFEYSGPNFPAYDIADHFSEWMSDYHNLEKPYFIHNDKYPSDQEQLNLLRSYVEYNFCPVTSNLKTEAPAPADDFSSLVDFEVKKLYNEIIFWRASVQFFWLIWGLIQHEPEADPVAALGSKSEAQGVESTYEYSTGINGLSLNDRPEEEDIITSTDDDFDYLKYSQQKAALIVGDMISFGLLSISDIPAEHHNKIKFLDTQTFKI